MPGGTSLLRQFGVQQGSGDENIIIDRKDISISDPRRVSVTDVDDGLLLPRGGSRRRLSVTDNDISRRFPAATAISVDVPDSGRSDRRPTSSLVDLTHVKKGQNDDEKPKDLTNHTTTIRLPHILSSNVKNTPMFSGTYQLNSKSHYSHLETSPSVESSDSGKANQKPIIESAVQKSVVPSTTVAATRISSARQRMKSARREPDTINGSSSNDNDEDYLQQTSSFPHHPHSPPAVYPNRAPSSKPSLTSSVGGHLLTVPDLANSLPSAPGVSSQQPTDGSLPKDQNQTQNLETTSKNNEKLDNKNGKIRRNSQAKNHNLYRTPTASTSSVLSTRGQQKAGGPSQGRQGTIDQVNGPGVFLNDGQRGVDFILVYQSGHSMHMEQQRRFFEKNLQQEGLILELDPLDGNDEPGKLCFVKVHAPWNTLCRSAEMLQMKMPLRNAELPDHLTSFQGIALQRGSIASFFELIFDALCSAWFKFNDTENLLIGRQSNCVTAQFTRARIEQFLITDTETFFTPTQRIRIVYDIMQRARCDPDNNKKRGLQWLLKNYVYSAAYPAHDGGTETRHLNTSEPDKWSQRQILKHTWANFNRVFKPQPLNLVRTYFGEKVGFYFAWLGFYTQMLVFPSIVGIICFLYGIFSLPNNPMIIELCDPEYQHMEPANLTMCPVCLLPYCQPWKLREGCEGASWNYRFDHESHVFMAVFTLVWATLFMELWKRKEAELACEWDAYDAEQEEEGMRPEYEARTQIIRVSPVTNEEEPYIPACKRILWGLQSLSGLFLLIICVIGALVALIIVRILLYGMLGKLGETWRHYQFELASLIIHVLTFVIVMTLGWIYEKAAHRLTELECPRTQADYLSSYIWKVFIFEILNNFAPVLYAALIRGRSGLPQNQTLLLEMCDPGGCLNEVVQAIAILLLARLLISNAAELGVPFLKSVLKTMRLGAAVNPEHEDEPTILRNLPRWQKDYTLNETNMDGVYAEYLEMMVQFGYVTLFVSAFPLAPLICLLNNIVEIRIDATNFVTSFRRPLPTRVSGIRIWRRCLNIMIKISVLSNGAFLAFTSELIPKLVYRLWYSTDGGSIYGYMRWTLAKVNTKDWPEYKEYANRFENSSECYYRDFRQTANTMDDLSLVWWQVMVARLAFFIIFVIAFYFIQWLCDFLVPDVPQHVKLRVDRANFLARQALYGHEMRGTNNSATPSSKSNLVQRNTNGGGPTGIGKTQNGPWSTATSAGLGDYYSQSNHALNQLSTSSPQSKSRPPSPPPLHTRILTVANGELTKNYHQQSQQQHGTIRRTSLLAEIKHTPPAQRSMSNGVVTSMNVNGFVATKNGPQLKSTDEKSPNFQKLSPSRRQNPLNDTDITNRSLLTTETTYV